MKNFTKILSLLSLSGLLFAGCYTQLATRDRDYSYDQGRQVYNDNNQGYSEQYQDSVYDDSSSYYGDDYYDSTGDNSYYDRGYR